MAKWVRRVTGRKYKGQIYPVLNLPAEFREWAGKEVEIIEISPKEIKVILKE